MTHYKFLSESFLSKYRDLPDPFDNVMSHFTYLRTYSRFLNDKNRREFWWETVARVVEYNCSLAHTAVHEAEQLFDNIYNLRQFPSGRSLWVASTEVAEKYPQSNYNCASVVFDDFDVLHEGFYLLLVGAGMGYRVLKSDVEKLPSVRNDIAVIHKFYEGEKLTNRAEYTELSFTGTVATITIGDSKEAWVNALKFFLELHYNKMYRDLTAIHISYDNIRPAGERLKTFGGYASGYQSMQKMFSKMNKLIKSATNKHGNRTKLKPIDCADLANIVGENVVSGGVRRTAIVITFDEDDAEMIESKSNLYELNNGKWIVNQDLTHRQMSNNSIFYYKKPTRDRMHWQINTMRYSGEPAFVNAERASKARKNFQNVNACAEVLLDSRGMCNLTEIVPLRFVKDGVLDRIGLFDAQRLSARMGFRMTLVDFELSKWDVINKRDRMVGCSITGWQDFVNVTNMSIDEQKELLQELKAVAKHAVESLALELKENVPVLVTTIKPSGTISLLPSVSAGLHFSHDEYYIRRIRISAHDPLADAMIYMGYDWKVEVGQDKNNPTTLVFEFPMKAPKGKTKYNVTAIEQLEIYKMFMENYVEQNASITVHVRDNEWDDVEQWMWDNWDDVVAISFLPLDDSFYDLLPYESITKTVYDDIISKLPKFDPLALQLFEHGEDFEMDDSDCASGVCPIK